MCVHMQAAASACRVRECMSAKKAFFCAQEAIVQILFSYSAAAVVLKDAICGSFWPIIQSADGRKTSNKFPDLSLILAF